MTIEELRDYCLEVKGVGESFPFNDTVPVFKIMDKMFAYFSLEPKDGRFCINLKCDPEKSAMLRDKYSGVTRGEYTKTETLLWNAVYIESDVPDRLIKELILHSVEEVIKKLPKKRQKEYIDSK